jgi:hypothetical protein
VGVRSELGLARATGLALGPSGGLLVDELKKRAVEVTLNRPSDAPQA